MLKLLIRDGGSPARVVRLDGETATIGRSPRNDILNTDASVSSEHGRFTLQGDSVIYEDLSSTNGSALVDADGNTSRIPPHTAVQLLPGAVIRIASMSVALDLPVSMLLRSPIDSGFTVPGLTVVMERPRLPVHDLPQDFLESASEAVSAYLQLVRDTANIRMDRQRFLDLAAQSCLGAFPRATNVLLASREPDGSLVILAERSRVGVETTGGLCRTVADRAVTEGLALLFSRSEKNLADAQSVAIAGIETGISAPLCGLDEAVGVLQIDNRGSATPPLDSADLERARLFSSHIGLTLEGLNLHLDHKRAFASTIEALVHSLYLKDPATAAHSERVQRIALLLGQALGLGETEMEVLGVASILHDLGKQGVADEVLFKPDRLTAEERTQIDDHAAHTEGILERVAFPRHLRSVPTVASYHHERMDGRGTFGIPGHKIPMASRIISVADTVDALASARAYKDPRSFDQIVETLSEGSGTQWDEMVVEAFLAVREVVQSTVFSSSGDEQDRSAA